MNTTEILEGKKCFCGGENAKWVEIANTYLCDKCNLELAESMEYVMTMDRSEDERYPQ